MVNRIRVLLVDDHQMFIDSLVRLLGDEDDLDVVGVAGSGEQCLAILGPSRPHVVVLDFQLPDGNGAVVATAVLRADPTVKVIMLTGQADVAAARAAAESGCSAFVTKDKAAQELVDCVRAAYEGRALLAPPDNHATTAAPSLSLREREVLVLLADGIATDVIADRLFISRNTVRAHVQRVITKLGAHSKLEAVAIARRHGLL